MPFQQRFRKITDNNAALIYLMNRVISAMNRETDDAKKQRAQTKVKDVQPAVEECANVTPRITKAHTDYLAGRASYRDVDTLMNEFERSYDRVNSAYRDCASILGI
ncbi:hypothetical protein M426DRAFT_265724 [Hypoxylon sp. CI-4A]|nr:hypothetical protein M426DRAFT_265724 [Hypoxylon sp. CI-4A]